MYQNYSKPFMQNTTGFGTPSASTFGNFQPGTSSQPVFSASLFGQQQASTSGNLFNSPTSNAFGQTKPTYGFGAVPNQTGLFGQQPQQQPAPLFQSNTPNLFGGNTSFGNTTQVQLGQQQQGTAIKFTAITGSDTMQKNGVAQSISTKHHCITCMKEYENKSLEELRYEDYQVNRKGPQEQATFASTPFGGSTAPQSTSLFGPSPQKPAGFGQPTGFGQTPAFGQNTSGFVTTTQTTTATPLFGNKTTTFGVATTNATNFGFNATSSNLFNTTQTKPFTQPSLFNTNTTPSTQSAFGTGMFGQTTQSTAAQATNLFQKPAQPNTGFSFNQPPNAQPVPNLFQMPKPATNFGMFGQTNTAFGQPAQPAFGNTFGKSTAFTQPTQTGFATAGTAPLQQQPPLFGNPANNKSTNLFGNLGGNTLLQNNTFQQPAANFSLNMTQPASQFPPESADDFKSMPILVSDLFPEGPQIRYMEPLFSGSKGQAARAGAALSPLQDSSKKNDMVVGANAKIKVHSPKVKRGTHFSRDFFEPNQSMKNSHKCLVIRKFNSNSNMLLNTIESAEEESRNNVATQLEMGQLEAPKKNVYFESISEVEDAEESRKHASFSSNVDTESTQTSEVDLLPTLDHINIETSAVEANAAGVVLTRDEYYMYPPLNELHRYMNKEGRCVVQGLTVGRRGYGNVYYPDPIDITGLNLDDIIHFRHREVIVYPDESQKPAVGEGLNRRAQVTLDKIYPREKGTDTYITDVDKIIESNFVNKLMHVTQKHKCQFTEYRPITGSWVFKVKHFSKYAFTESDEDECELTSEQLAAGKKPSMLLKDYEVQDSLADISMVGGGDALIHDKYKYLVLDPKNIVDESFMIDYADEGNGNEYVRPDFNIRSPSQTIKLSLFNEATQQMFEKAERKSSRLPAMVESVPCEVICVPEVEDALDIGVNLPGIATRPCPTQFSLWKKDHFKVGWMHGLTFFGTDLIPDTELIFAANSYNVDVQPDVFSTEAMPHMDDILQTTFEQTVFSFDDDNVPSLTMKTDLAFLNNQTEVFNKYVRDNDLTGRHKYLAHMWNLCTALWGDISEPGLSRRHTLSDWLSLAAGDLWESLRKIRPDAHESHRFAHLFQLLSRRRINDAAHFAQDSRMSHASLLISQAGGSARFRQWMERHIATFHSEKESIVPNELKVLDFLLAGIAAHDGLNVCKDMEWLKCFGMYLWYLAPGAAPISVVFELFKQAAEDVCDVKEDDIIYHIIALYACGNYELNKVLHPAIQGTNMTDYRVSWLLLQLFTSLGKGLIKPLEQEYMHATFATQLENMGEWKWAIFVLLFLENNHMKKQMIMDILERNLLVADDAADTLDDLVDIFKLPSTWIHELVAISGGKLTCRNQN